MEVIDKNYALTLDDIFDKIADLYFDYEGNFSQSPLFSHLHNSFNECITNDIPLYLEKMKHIVFETITENDVVIKYYLVFKNIQIKQPMMDSESELMYPQDARDRNLTYSLKIIADITQMKETINLKTLQKENVPLYTNEKILVAIVPLMVKSKFCNITLANNNTECNYDPGGYFIVNGMEKVVMSIERMCENKPLVFIKKEANIIVHTVQVNSKSYEVNGMTQIITIKAKKNNMLVLNVSIMQEVSIFIILRALGLETDMEIINAIVPDKNDIDMINRAIILLENSKSKNKIMNKEDALNFLATKLKIVVKYNETDKNIKQQQKKIHLIETLENNFFPHIKSGENRSTGKMLYKAYYICYMINRLLEVLLERKQPDDRDSFVNKRVDTVGNFIEDIFKQQFKKMMGDCHKFFKEKNNDVNNPINVINKLNPNIILQGLRTALSLGNWGKKQGVAQMLMRMTYIHPLSFLRRVDAPNIEKQKIKSSAPRRYNGSQTGFISFVETQEHGGKIGLIKNMTLLSSITTLKYSQIKIIKDILKNQCIDILYANRDEHNSYGKIFINGDWLGLSPSIIELGNMMRQLKLNGTLDNNIGIVIDISTNELKIYCDAGRLFRPVFRVINNVIQIKKNDLDDISTNKNDKTKINTWNQLLMKKPHIFEYIDMAEAQNLLLSPTVEDVYNMHEIMVSSIGKKPDTGKIINRYDDRTYKKYTHCELHPSLLEGVLGSNICFMNRNDAPRNIFQYSQGKQAISLYLTNYRDRMDICYILRHAQKSLVSTRPGKYTHINTLPCGENIIVAVSVYNGHNQEDAIIVNEGALQRGLFTATYYRKYDSTIKKNPVTSQNDIFMNPDNDQVSEMRHYSCKKLNDKGIVPVETVVKNGDVVIGKVTPLLPTDGGKKYRDSSTIYKSLEDGIIDRCIENIQTSEGYGMTKMSIRSERIPKIGDKFCLREFTEVLTSTGWKSICNVTKNDSVATLIDGKFIKYEKPLDIMNFKYDGKMYKLRSKYVDLDATIDHKLYVKKNNESEFKLITAHEAFQNNVSFKKNCSNNFKIEISHMDFIFKNETIDNEFSDIVWSLSQDQCLFILNELIDDDMNYYTTSSYFADQMMRLAIHSGLSATIMSFSTDNSDVYLVHVITETENNEPRINNDEEEIYDYEGNVYCIEVPSNIFMMRQNGKNIWIGNCCYTDEHDVLTDQGWINISKLTTGYKVASLVNDHELQYVYPTEIQKYDYEGPMYLVESQQVNLCVTPNHRMYVAPRVGKKYKIEEAQHIFGKAKRYKKNIEIYNPINQKTTFTLPAFGDFPEKEIDMDVWCVFFGIWMAEGCTHSNPDYICYAAHKQRVKDALTKCCEVLDLRIYKHVDKKNDEDIRNIWCIFDKQYTAYMTPFSVGAVNKFLPKWCFDLTIEQSRKLIDGMLLGDGHTNNSGTKIYDTSSVQLADDFQRLCLHAGYSTNIMLKYEAGHESFNNVTQKMIKSTVDAWRMSVITKQNNPLVNKTVQLDQYVPFTGSVYCCTVPSGVIYVRRKSTPVWCGQSRNGNKGTIGSILPENSMPFTEQGIVPDLVVTPYAFMGRRIFGQLFESLTAKISSINGAEDADGTPYVDIDLGGLMEQLEKLNYNGDGTEWLYNGMTGQRMESKIFIAPVYYQRLKHIVFDKMHSRHRGPKTILVRQPPEGRARDGGGRLGEMERDALIAHGVSFFIKEKLMDTSDAFCVQVCNKCGLFAQRLVQKDSTHYPVDTDIYFCKACNNKTDISKTIIPYAFKLLIQEMMAMNIAPRLRLKAH